MDDPRQSEAVVTLLDHLSEAILIEDGQRIVTYANAAFARLFLPPGEGAQGLLGSDCAKQALATSFAFIESAAWLERTGALVSNPTRVQGEVWEMTGGRWVERDYLPHIESGTLIAHRWIYRDVTAEHALPLQLPPPTANIAAITSVARDRGSPELGTAAQELIAVMGEWLNVQPVTLVLVKVLGMDRINAQFGAGIGDAVLSEIPGRLRSALPGSIVLRLHGATMAIASPTTAPARDTMGVIREVLQSAVEVGSHLVFVTYALGSASLDPKVTVVSPILLFQRALAALSEAQRAKQDFVFDEDLIESERRRNEIGLHLPQAIIAGEFSMVYQPICDLNSRVVVAHESLVRWQHPRFGVIDAASFVPVAEEMSIIPRLDEWVAATVLGEIQRVTPDGTATVAINLSALTLDNPEAIVPLIRDGMRTHRVHPHQVVIEITETAIARNPQNAIRALRAFKKLGVRVALDDFGVGTSNLTQLKDSQFDFVKLDKAFTSSMYEARVRTLIRAACDMAAGIGAVVIAEGIEHEWMVQPLIESGVTLGQGWYFGAPAPLPND
jgi:EAL domain-containing protein (putative c-di-GMP-specific phosphodiesterase class I)/GGDEF domain-containing protein